jgi:hypothetical protein
VLPARGCDARKCIKPSGLLDGEEIHQHRGEIMKNPYLNPIDGKSGFTHKQLASLTPEELLGYIAWYRWRQEHESFPDKPRNVYQSKAYFMYRTNQFVYDAQKLLVKNQAIDGSG